MPASVLEVETPAHTAPASGGGCFPIKLCGCLGNSPVLFMIPGTWQTIQDTTHLTLVVGVISTFIMIVSMLADIFSGAGLAWRMTHPLQAAKEGLAIVFILPCCFYFVRIIGQYDEKLQAKHAQCKIHKETLARSYNDLLSDMDGLLGKAAESSAGLAERSFESKRRDFLRFLERAKGSYGRIYTGNKGDSDELFKQFRRFCMNWLQVFEECSIDPIQCPKRVVTTEELNRCTSIIEVCDLCLERLRVTEVRFISVQRDQDAQMLKKNRVELRRLTAAPDALDQSALMAMPAREASGELLTSGTSNKCTWFVCGSSGCRCSSANNEDKFPKTCGCLCFKLVCLSKEHIMLVMAFLVGWVIIGIELFSQGVDVFGGGEAAATTTTTPAPVVVDTGDNIVPDKEEVGFRRLGSGDKPSPIMGAVFIGQVLISQVCLLVMLLRFEELDIIQQLEREVKGMEKQVEQVNAQRTKMKDFWSNAQQLTELWLYRTVPRLDLFKEVHSQIEDADTGKILVNLSCANQHLEDLEHNLGELKAWRNDGVIKVDQKKAFGKVINQLCQETEFDAILYKLAEATKSQTMLMN